MDIGFNAGEVRRGVRVGAVELGGKTLPEARRALQNETAEPLEQVRVIGPGGVSFTAGEMGLRLDVAATSGRAYAVGREGNILKRLGDRLGAVWGGVPVSPEVAYDPPTVGEGLATLPRPCRRRPGRPRSW